MSCYFSDEMPNPLLLLRGERLASLTPLQASVECADELGPSGIAGKLLLT